MKTPQEIHELFKEKNLPSNFCIIPFVNMIFNPNGEIGICRQKGNKHVVGSLEKNSIEEIWNNEYLQKWREEFLTGNVCICKREIEEEFCNLGSTNYEYFDEVKLNKVQKLPMQKFTANFNGKCNLECIMCDVWKLPNGYYDEGDFWNKAEHDFFPHIKEVELLSGEPFIQKDTWKLIEKISNVNQDCLWSFTTNAHWVLNKNIINHLNKIKIKNIHISIDSLDGSKYSKIRRKGNLSIVLNNVENLLKYNTIRKETGQSDLGLALHFLVMKENWKELKDIIKYTKNKKIQLILDLLKEPQVNSLLSLKSVEKIDIINTYLSNLDKEEIKASVRIILPLIKSLTPIEQKSFLLELNRVVYADS